MGFLSWLLGKRKQVQLPVLPKTPRDEILDIMRREGGISASDAVRITGTRWEMHKVMDSICAKLVVKPIRRDGKLRGTTATYYPQS